MYDAALTAHSLLRWAAVVMTALFTAAVLHGWRTRRRWTPLDERLGFFFMGAVDLQATLGLALYMWLSPIPPAGFAAFGDDLMRSAALAFFTVVHPIAMIVAVVVAHLGHARRKATDDDSEKFRAQGLALLGWAAIVLAAIPWPGLSYGRALLRW